MSIPLLVLLEEIFVLTIETKNQMISRQGLKNKIKRYGLEGYDDEEEGMDGVDTADEDDED